MDNNTQLFLEKHPDFQPIATLYKRAYQEEYGNNVMIDIAESQCDAEQRREFY